MVSMFETRFLNFGGIAQLARASALQAEGHRFDSDYLHQNILRCVAVVASQSHKLKVVGSSPTIRNQVSKDFKNKHLSKKQ